MSSQLRRCPKCPHSLSKMPSHILRTDKEKGTKKVSLTRNDPLQTIHEEELDECKEINYSHNQAYDKSTVKQTAISDASSKGSSDSMPTIHPSKFAKFVSASDESSVASSEGLLAIHPSKIGKEHVTEESIKDTSKHMSKLKLDGSSQNSKDVSFSRCSMQNNG